MYRIFPAIRRGFRPSRMTSNNLISPMKFCYNTNSTLPKQCQSSRSVLQDGSRTFGLFWKEKTPSYNRRNTVLRHEKIPETHVLATLLTGNAWLFMEKRSFEYQVSTSYLRIFRFLEVRTGSLNLCNAQSFKTKNSEISCIYRRTSMARTTLDPLKYVRDRGSSR